jgi:hypothetical protein
LRAPLGGNAVESIPLVFAYFPECFYECLFSDGQRWLNTLIFVTSQKLGTERS